MRASERATAQDVVDPGTGHDEVLVARARGDDHLGAVEPGVGAEEAHEGASAVQADEGRLDPLVADVPLDVDGEAVAAQGVAGRARLDAGEVDAAGRELLQQLDSDRGQ